MGGLEEMINIAVRWLRLIIEAVGACVVAVGAFSAGAKCVLALFGRHEFDFTRIRLDLARYLALGLEFQLAADILSTAVAPTWEQIGKLGAIAVIRTALNYFLMKEMEVERSELHQEAE